MTLEDLLSKLWQDYSTMNTQAGAIHSLLEQKGETVVNDHIAFRTFNDPRVGIDAVARKFVELGYVKKDNYDFAAKKLNAHHYEHTDKKYPLIFVSELKVEEFSEFLQSTVKDLIGQVTDEQLAQDDFVVSGLPWEMISFETYNKLKEESEYAAWVSVFGYRANHFTVLLNSLTSFSTIEEFNSFLKDNNFVLNSSGGEVKGTEKDFLQQSSTMADTVDVEFSDQTTGIPCCYYEFAKRYKLPNGDLFSGFVAKSADKIFESTDNKEG